MAIDIGRPVLTWRGPTGAVELVADLLADWDARRDVKADCDPITLRVLNEPGQSDDWCESIRAVLGDARTTMIEPERSSVLAAVGEYRLGAARGLRHTAVCCIESVWECVPLLDGEIWRGAHDRAGPAWPADVRPLLDDVIPPDVTGTTLREISGAAEQWRVPWRDDGRRATALPGYATLLARVLETVAIMLDPDRIVLTGDGATRSLGDFVQVTLAHHPVELVHAAVPGSSALYGSLVGAADDHSLSSATQ